MSRTPDTTTVNTLLNSAEHRSGLHDLTLEISAVTRRYPWLTRVSGRVRGMADTGPDAWAHPNLAVRLAVPDADDALGAIIGQPGLCRRVYTLAEVDTASGTADIDIVVHGSTSPMMRWLAGLAPGDTVDFAGPRPHAAPALPADGARVHLLADGSAYPAASAIARSLPAGTVATVILDLPDDAPLSLYESDFPGAERLVRTNAVAGSTTAAATPTPLADALASVNVGPGDTVWAAGEREDIRAVRAHCLNDFGLPRAQVQVFGYWRHGKTGTDADIARLEGATRLRAEGRDLSADNDFEIEI